MCADNDLEGRGDFLSELGEKTDKRGLVHLLVRVQMASEKLKERRLSAQAVGDSHQTATLSWHHDFAARSCRRLRETASMVHTCRSATGPRGILGPRDPGGMHGRGRGQEGLLG